MRFACRTDPLDAGIAMSDTSQGSALLFSLAGNIRKTGEQLGVHLERLGSGMRINSAADDAAALAVAVKLDAEARVYSKASAGGAIASSRMTQATTAVDALQSVMTSIQEYVGTAQSELITFEQRTSIQSEVDTLRAEYNRIVASVTTSGEPFDPNLSTIALQAGPTRGDVASASLGVPSTELVGSGAFGAASAMASSLTDLRTVSSGDIDNDGDLDIVYGNLTGGSLGVRLGNGEGTFAAETTLGSGGNGVQFTTLADVTGDGTLDLLTNEGGTRLAVYRGNGDGTFGTRSTVLVGTGVNTISVGDFNGDSISDVAVSSDADNAVYISLGNNSGTFSTFSSLASGAGGDPDRIAIADLNGDGNQDLAVTSVTSAEIQIFMGNGDGTFQSRVTYAAGTRTVEIAAGDIDNDGDLDLVAADLTNGTVLLYSNSGSGTFGASTSVGSTGAQTTTVALRDLNGDGNLDLVAGSLAGGQIAVLTGTGSGTFSPFATYAATSAGSVQLGDFSGDGVTDMVYVSSGTANVFYRAGTAVSASRTIGLEELDAVSILTVPAANAAAEELQSAADDLAVLRGATVAGATKFDSVSGFAAEQSELRFAAAETIQQADIAESVLEQVRLTLLGEQQGAAFASALELSRSLLLLLDD
jgi:flagellin-like hook-associated protein FlgL